MRLLPDFIIARALEEVKGLELVLDGINYSLQLTPAEKKAAKLRVVRKREQCLALWTNCYQAQEGEVTSVLVRELVQLISPCFEKSGYKEMYARILCTGVSLYHSLGGTGSPHHREEPFYVFLDRVNHKFYDSLAKELSRGKV